MKWQTVELGSCVQEMRGGASVTEDDLTESGMPVLHKGVIREGGKIVFDRDGKAHVSEAYAKTKSTAIVTSEYVIATLRNLVKTGETLGFIAPAPSGRNYLLAQGAYGLRLDDEKLDKRYLSHLSNAWVFHKEILKRMVGSTQVHIRNGQFLEVPIPLPPLAEQKRIAGILDAADALRAKRREALAQLDTLLQATFLDLFGDPVTNPKGWEKTPLGEIAIKVTDGDHHTPKRATSGIKLLSARNVLDGEIDLSNTDFVEEPEYKRMIQRCHPEKDDILISCSGSIGRVSRIRFEEPVVLVRSAALVKLDRSKVTPEFVEHLLRTPALKAAMLKSAKSSSQANLFQKPIRNLPALLPPLELQRRFAEVIAKIESHVRVYRSHLAELDALFASLQSRAFRGEL